MNSRASPALRYRAHLRVYAVKFPLACSFVFFVVKEFP